MKIFIDTEFYEYPPLSVRGQEFIDTPGANAIQLISLGAVREDGAEFYAENAEFSWEDIPEDHWLQENVRPNLWGGPLSEKSWERTPFQELKDYTNLVAGAWPPSRIAQEFHSFATPEAGSGLHMYSTKPEFWGYFCDYDWVVLCGLYGRMVDLPPEFPMYCLDLKQEMHRMGIKRDDLPVFQGAEHHALADARWICDSYYHTTNGKVTNV